jgi:bifunctional N-acetylglucosamine-1-phosphate-uridyltransferase/glucosamine-1-phosphate-acetyltransferase GlmU-like protein
VDSETVIITMGDAPLIKPSTYQGLVDELYSFDIVVLGFSPREKKQFGLLITEKGLVKDIVEWKYWKNWKDEDIENHSICNAGIYAFKRNVLLALMGKLKDKGHVVEKEIDGEIITFEEYFMTDLIKIANDEKHKVGFVVTESETEAMGVDDPEALKLVQIYFASSAGLDSTP